MADKTPSQKPVSTATYLIISVVSLLAAFAVGYYYFQYMKQGGNEKMDDRIFYLVLVLFGMAASALIFGIMNSYASLKGIKTNVTYKFTGPVVGVILTVIGGFMLPKGSTDQFLSIRIFDQDKIRLPGAASHYHFLIISGKDQLMKRAWSYFLKYLMTNCGTTSSYMW